METTKPRWAHEPRDLLRELDLTQNPRLARLAGYVRSHLDQRLPLSTAAAVVGLERTYFSKYFRDVMDRSFSEWNGALRMEVAKSMLWRRHVTILTVALTVGYRDLTTFERAFKRHIGLSPRGYRKHCIVLQREQAQAPAR